MALLRVDALGDAPRRRVRAIAAMSAVWALLLAVVVIRQRPPAVVPTSAPATAFSGERAYATLAGLLRGVGPHPTGSRANAVVRSRLMDSLRGLGWEPSLQRARSCGRYGRCADVVNVIARRSPRGGDHRPVVLLCAHYDSTPSSPGAADDGAGVAALLEVARALGREEETAQELVLLFTDGEELGLLGAQAFVDEHPLAPQVEAVVNLEARGTAGPSLLFRTSEASLPAVERYAALAPRPVANSVGNAVFSFVPHDTDLTVFLDGDRIALDFAFIEAPRHYHAPTDDLAHLDRRSLQHQGDHALATARALTRGPLERGPPSVWADVFGLFVVGMSQRALLVLVALALAASLYLGGRASLRPRDATRAAAVLAGGLAVAGGLGLTVAFATAPATPWATAPTPYVVAAHAVGALVFAGAGLALRRTSAMAIALTLVALFSIGALALGGALPSASHLLGAPAMAGAIALAVGAPGRHRSRRDAQRVAGAMAVASAVFLFPLGTLLYPALGHHALAGVAGVFFLALAPALPLFGAQDHAGEPIASGRGVIDPGPDRGTRRGKSTERVSIRHTSPRRNGTK